MYFQICKYVFFLIFEKSMSKKLSQVTFRFASMLFLKYLRNVSAKNFLRYFQIYKYAFFKYFKKGITCIPCLGVYMHAFYKYCYF